MGHRKLSGLVRWVPISTAVIARAACLIAILMPALPAWSARAQGYGYSREKDPLVTGVKKTLAFGRSEDWEQAQEALGTLDWQVKELRQDLEVDLGPALEAALRSRDLQQVGYELTHLVFQALRQKFHWNLKEKLERSTPARSRLDAARFYYEEILSHAVRRADKAEDRQRHTDILRRFDDLRGTLGSPGLFGVGASDPDRDEFERLSGELVKLLREVYPRFEQSKQEARKPGRREARNGNRGSGSQETRRVARPASCRVASPLLVSWLPDPVSLFSWFPGLPGFLLGRFVLAAPPRAAAAPGSAASQDDPHPDADPVVFADQDFFRVEDLETDWRDRLPFEVSGRADLTYLNFGDRRNVDGFDDDELLLLNPALRLKYDITEDLFFVGEAEWDGEDDEVESDELHLGLRVPSAGGQLTVGVNYIPFGIERFSYAPPANALVDRPSPFRRIFPGTYSDLGLFWWSEHEVAESRDIRVEVAVTRGLTGPRREDRSEDWIDSRDSPQLSARVGFRPIPVLEVGVSGLTVHHDDRPMRSMWLAGADLSVHRGPYTIKAETITGRVDHRGAQPDFGRRGWYIQAVRRIEADWRYCRGLEVVIRVDVLDENDTVRDFRDVDRYTFGFNWWIRDDLRLKTEYSISDEQHHEISNNGFLVQLGWHF